MLDAVSKYSTNMKCFWCPVNMLHTCAIELALSGYLRDLTLPVVLDNSGRLSKVKSVHRKTLPGLP